MNSLVFVKDNQVVTDSLTVADVFEKRHDRVLQDIRELECSEEFSLHNFVESTYKNSVGREYPQYFMTEQGFSLLVMGYTGKEAMRFKERYINEFHEMRNQLRNNVVPMNEKESLIALMKLSAMTAEETEELKTITKKNKNEIEELKEKVDNQITLSYGEQRRLQKAVAIRVYELFDNPADRPKAFGGIYREIKNRFAVASYKDVKKNDLQAALNYVKSWIPIKESKEVS